MTVVPIALTASGGEATSPFTFMFVALVVALIVFVVACLVSMSKKLRLHRRFLEHGHKNKTLRPQLGAIVRRLGLAVLTASFPLSMVSGPDESLYMSERLNLPYIAEANGFAPLVLAAGVGIFLVGWLITRVNREYIKPTLAEMNDAAAQAARTTGTTSPVSAS